MNSDCAQPVEEMKALGIDPKDFSADAINQLVCYQSRQLRSVLQMYISSPSGGEHLSEDSEHDEPPTPGLSSPAGLSDRASPSAASTAEMAEGLEISRMPHDSSRDQSCQPVCFEAVAVVSDCRAASCEAERIPAAAAMAVSVEQNGIVTVQTETMALFKFERFLNTRWVEPRYCYRVVSPQEYAGQIIPRKDKLRSFFNDHRIDLECMSHFSLCAPSPLERAAARLQHVQHTPALEPVKASHTLEPVKAAQIAEEAAQILQDGCLSIREMSKMRGKLQYHVQRTNVFKAEVVREKMQEINSFIGSVRDPTALDVKKRLPEHLQDELQYWVETLKRYSKPDGGGSPMPRPASAASAAGGNGTERKLDAVEGCTFAVRELLSHDLLTQEFDSQSSLHVRRLLRRLLERLDSDDSSYSKGWSLREEFVSGLRASVESKAVPLKSAKLLMSAFDKQYERFVPYEMGIHPRTGQFIHGAQWLGTPILAYFYDAVYIRASFKAEIQEYSSTDSSYLIRYEDKTSEWISLPSHDIEIDTGAHQSRRKGEVWNSWEDSALNGSDDEVGEDEEATSIRGDDDSEAVEAPLQEKPADVRFVTSETVDRDKYTGKNLLKRFDNRIFLGQVVSQQTSEKWWHVVYEDGDSESMDEKEVKDCIRKLSYQEKTPSVVRLQKLENKVMEWKSNGLGNEQEASRTKVKSSASNGASSRDTLSLRKVPCITSVTAKASPPPPTAKASPPFTETVRSSAEDVKKIPRDSFLGAGTAPFAQHLTPSTEPPSLAVVTEDPTTEMEQEPLPTAVSTDKASVPIAGDAASLDHETQKTLSAWEDSLLKREKRMEAREGRMQAREGHLDTREERLLEKEKQVMERERMIDQREVRPGATSTSQENELRKSILHDIQILEVNKRLAEKELELVAMQKTKRKLERELSGTDIGRSPTKRHRVQLEEGGDLVVQSQFVTPTSQQPALTSVPKWPTMWS